MAAQRPPALKAIMSASATEDLYVDNMHYMGGCLLSDNLSEATVMFAFNSMPPDPAIVGDRWREMWHERLAGSGLWIDQWLEHQHRDDYWKRASVNEDYSAVHCPVLTVGGWADGYTNAIFRLLEHLDVPRLIGPWGHKYPHLGIPGPAIGFLQELVRWWDHWLKGRDTGIMDEPMLRAWMQDSVSPQSSYADRPGRWVGEPSWPSPNIRPHRYTLDRWSLTENPDEVTPRRLRVQSPLSVGMFAGKWAPYPALAVLVVLAAGVAVTGTGHALGAHGRQYADPAATPPECRGRPAAPVRAAGGRACDAGHPPAARRTPLEGRTGPGHRCLHPGDQERPGHHPARRHRHRGAARHNRVVQFPR
nr:CocE/NonD family hydrolase [Nocardia brevicatena]